MSLVVSDSFTDTDGVLLDAHVGEVGATWTKHPSSAAQTMSVASNRLIGSGSGALYYASGVPAAAEQDVEAIIRVVSLSSLSPGILGRMSTTATSFYMARLSATSGGTVELSKFTPGFAVLATTTFALTLGQDYTLKLEIRDAAKKVYVNGTEVLSSADNTITTAGRGGLRSELATSTTRFNVDTFTLNDIPGAVSEYWGVPL